MKEELYHFIGIGGIGMSGLAKILIECGQTVHGSDMSSNDLVLSLKGKGATIFKGHDSKQVSASSKVIYTSAVNENNSEYKAALKMKLPMLHRSDLLNDLMQGYKPLLVTGTHGKTTTTALLSTVLLESGKNPSFVVGGVVNSYKTNAGHGTGEYFVAEADESDGSFLKTPSFGAIVTNLEREHIDYWKSEEKLRQGFQKFFSQVKSSKHLFWCGDDPILVALKPSGVSYGFSNNCALCVSNVRQKGFSLFFDITFEGKKYSDITLPLAGKHNALNAGAVFGLALRLGVTEGEIRKAFLTFTGIGRRLQKIGERSSVSFFDDYGHHPTEIAYTIKALREAILEKRLIVVFQPHRYSRTKDLLKEFGKCFDEADLVILTDLYSAFEKPIEGIDTDTVLKEIQKHDLVDVKYIPKDRLAESLSSMLQVHDVVLFQGAGDISDLGCKSFTYFAGQNCKLKVGLLFGGRSAEHEVSIVSAKNVAKCLDRELYDVEIFGLTKDNKWILGEDSFIKVSQGAVGEELNGAILKELLACDLFFPVMHGPFGEDGAIQGFFEMFGKSYVGCDWRASAVAMNKIWTKEFALCNGVATSPFVNFRRIDWKQNRVKILNDIKEKISFRLYVKPAHLGSSVGVKRVATDEELIKAIDEAFLFDDEVLVEEEIRGQEIEFALLGNDFVEVSVAGEILTRGECYDYEKKYGNDPMPTQIPAAIAPEKMQEGQMLAKKAFLAAGGKGMARVDFFLDHKGKFWLNEINPIPGFTAISLYPKMWEASGIDALSLINRLIVLALHKNRINLRHKIAPNV